MVPAQTSLDWWTAIAALAAGASAIFAGVQIWFTRRDARRVSLLDHLQTVESRLRPILDQDMEVVQPDVLASYRREKPLTDAGRGYVSFLTALDLLAFARQANTVDRKLADEYVRTLILSHMVSQTFIVELQRCCNDAAIYEHLQSYLLEARNHRIQEAIRRA